MTFPVVASIGEILIDFISQEIGTLENVEYFQKCPGGAPANFAVGMARCGIDVAFIGKVGADPFGKFLIKVLNKEGVNVKGVIKDKSKNPTSIAFVSLDKKADRDFLFYRKEAADLKLTEKEINTTIISNVKFIHFGTVSLSSEPSRSATLKAIEICKNSCGLACFDPNIRRDLWENEFILREILDRALMKTDILYLSKEELDFILKKDINDHEAIDEIFSKYPIKIIALKKGKDGCIVKERNGFFLTIPSFDVPAVDTTGAGDGFNVGFILGLLENLSLEEAAILGNAIGALVIQKKGAMTALPDREELKEFLIMNNVKIPI